MPSVLDPARFMSLAANLSRPMAATVLVVALSMLVLGSRAFRVYAALAAALVGYAIGVELARLMYVHAAFAAWPLSVVGAWIAYMRPWRLLALAMALVVGAIMARIFARWLGLPDYSWTGFALGAALGLGFALFMRRSAAAVLTAGCGSALVVATLGSVVRAPEGPFAIGAYAAHPAPFAVSAGLVFVVAVILQLAQSEENARSSAFGGLQS